MTRAEAACVGALIGTFVGDGLGAPVEGRSTEAIREEHGRLDEMLSERGGAGVEQLLEQPGRPELERVAKRLGNDSRAFASVPAAVYAALSRPDSFEGAVVDALMLGGDTDTIGAMAGAIAGGLHGVDAVPEPWWEPLENGQRGRDHVVELGERLAAFAAEQA